MSSELSRRMHKRLKRTGGDLTSRYYQPFSPKTDFINQVKDMQTKLDEAESLAVQGGRKVTSRLEQKIKVHFTLL